jgi:hypothetical protein
VSRRTYRETVQVIATGELSALDQLAAARLRGAKPDELLELAEAAIDQATAAGDVQTIESVAEELDLAAPAHPDEGDGLRLRLAAGRARALASRPSGFAVSDAASAGVDAPTAAKVAFWTTLAIGAVTLFSFGAMSSQEPDSAGSWGIAVFLFFLLGLGALVVLIAGTVGFVQSVRAGSRRGMLMSAGPVLFLIVLRISISLF